MWPEPNSLGIKRRVCIYFERGHFILGVPLFFQRNLHKEKLMKRKKEMQMTDSNKKLWFLCAGASDGRLPKTKVEGLLISAGYDCKNAGIIQRTNEMIQKAKAKHVILDSGGFQIFSAEGKGIPMTFDPRKPLLISKKVLNITPQHVVEKAIEIQADSVVALDFPIRKIRNPEEQNKEFRKKLNYNVKWAIETAALRKKLCPEINLFIPVQAYNLTQFKEFCKGIEGIDFDGFSLPIRNMSMLNIAEFLLAMHKMGIKKVHILGSSSLPVMSVCAFMSEKFFDWVSFDATTWRIAAQYGNFIKPNDLSIIKHKNTSSYDPKYKCSCMSCKGRTLKQIFNLDRKERMNILTTHNYLAVRKLCNKFGRASVNSQYIKKHLGGSKRSDKEKILRDMSEIEKMCSIDISRK